jgi:hypothetical protein
MSAEDYSEMFIFLGPILDELMSAGEISETVLIALHLLMRFVETGICSPSDLLRFDSLSELCAQIAALVARDPEAIHGAATTLVAISLITFKRYAPNLQYEPDMDFVPKPLCHIMAQSQDHDECNPYWADPEDPKHGYSQAVEEEELEEEEKEDKTQIETM